MLFHLDVLTGEDSRKASSAKQPLEGLDIISGPLVEAFLLQIPDNQAKIVVLVDEFLQVLTFVPSE